MFTSEGEAKRFLVGKIAAQAAAEGVPLSDAEQRMLSFSESDPEFAVEPAMIEALVEQLAAEISDEDYEARITGLIRRSCERAMASDRGAFEAYREASVRLGDGDHHLSVMLERGLSAWLKPWWAFWR